MKSMKTNFFSVRIVWIRQARHEGVWIIVWITDPTHILPHSSPINWITGPVQHIFIKFSQHVIQIWRKDFCPQLFSKCFKVYTTICNVTYLAKVCPNTFGQMLHHTFIICYCKLVCAFVTFISFNEIVCTFADNKYLFYYFFLQYLYYVWCRLRVHLKKSNGACTQTIGLVWTHFSESS